MKFQEQLQRAEKGWTKQEGKVVRLKRKILDERRRNSILNGDMLQLKSVKPAKKGFKGLSLADEMEDNPKDKPVSNLALEMNFDEEEMFMPSAQTVQNRGTINFTPKGTQEKRAFAFPSVGTGLSMSQVFQLEVLPEKVPEPVPEKEPEPVAEIVSKEIQESEPPQKEPEEPSPNRRRRRERVLQQRKPAIEEYFMLTA